MRKRCIANQKKMMAINKLKGTKFVTYIKKPVNLKILHPLHQNSNLKTQKSNLKTQNSNLKTQKIIKVFADTFGFYISSK